MADEDVVLRIAADVRSALESLNAIKNGVREIKPPAEEAASGLEHLFLKMTGAATVGSLFAGVIEGAVREIINFGRESLDAGARVEQLAGVADFLGQRAGYSSRFVRELSEEMQRTGITGREAYDAIIQLTRANIDLDNATRLQAAAQNSASIAGKSSSETFGLLVRGITTLTPELIRSAGFTTNLETALRDAHEATGRATSSFTGAEKQLLLMNSVLREADEITGVYGKSMDFAAKQQNSLLRVIQQMQEQIGLALVPVTSEVTKLFLQWAEALRDVDMSSLNDAAKNLAYFIGEVVKPLTGELLPAIWELGTAAVSTGKEVGTDLVKSINDLLKSLGLIKEGEQQTFTQFWVDRIKATTKEIEAIKNVLNEIKEWHHWAMREGGAIGYIFNLLRGQAGELPKVTSAWVDLKDRGVKPLVDVNKALTLGQGDFMKGLAMMTKEADGAIRGGINPLTQAHKLTEKEMKEAAKRAKEWADVLTDLNVTSQSSAQIVETLDDEVYQGIRYYLERGVKVDTLAKLYGVLTQQVKGAQDQMKFESSVLQATNKMFGNMVAIVPDLSKRTQEFENELNGLTREGLLPANREIARQVGLMPDLHKGHKNISVVLAEEREAARLAAIEGIDKLAASLHNLAQVAPLAVRSLIEGLATIAVSYSSALKAADTFKAGMAEIHKPGGSLLTGLASITTGIVGIASAAIAMAPIVIGAFKKLFGITSEWEKITKQISKDYDANVSQQLAKSIEADSKRLHDRNLAIALHMNEIIQAAGGVTSKNVERFVQDANRLIEGFRRGTITAAEATKQLGSAIPEMAKAATDANGLMSESFLTLLRNARATGLQIQSITDIINGQLDKLSHGNQTVVAGFISAIDKVADASLTYQTEFDRVSRITLAAFNAEIAAGKSATQAIAALGPSIDPLIAAAKKFGFEGNAAFDQLKRWRELVKDNQELLDSVAGLNDMMVALANLGSLDADTFEDMQAQGLDTFHKLTAAGLTQQEAEAQMKPLLESIIKLHNERGLAIDAETQALIDQAEQDGILKADQISTNDILLQGFKALIEAVGGKMPEAFQKMAKAAKDAAGVAKSEMDGVAASVDEVNFGASPGGLKEIPILLRKSQEAAVHFATQFKAQMRTAKEAAERVGEMVIGPSGQIDITGSPLGSIPSAYKDIPGIRTAGGGPGADPHVSMNLFVMDATGLQQAVETKILPMVVSAVRQNRRQSKTDLNQALKG